jgi:hypothetical protein
MADSFLELAEAILKKADAPLIYQEIWRIADATGLAAKLGSSGKTPWQSLGSRLYVDVRDNPATRFIKVGKRPARFFLRAREGELSASTIAGIDKTETRKLTDIIYKERDLHAILTYFAYANPAFSRGRSIFTKTIFHESAKKNGYSEWNYPDMVGFYLPLEEWRPEVIEFNRISDSNSIQLYSFEIKKSLSKSTYRESFFQAVSNSSWAHEGYLVAAQIQQDDDLMTELKRLSTSFGIGIIQLDIQDIDASEVLFPARFRSNLDWDTINKLCEQSDHFCKFIKDVKIDYDSKRIHRSDYDNIPEDPSTLAIKIAR